jgi:uncharacterized RDD family membrane protein YckC
MNWYYVDAGQQAGPVDYAQLAELARNGRVQYDTLVWHEGLENWQPCRDANAALFSGSPPPVAAAPPPALAAHEAVCAECGRIFNRQDLISHGTMYVCANCKPVFMQKLAEGASLNTGMLSYAGFWTRFAAKFLDGLILGAIFMVPLFYVIIKGATSGRSARFQLLQVFLQFGYLAANVLYQVFFLGKYGATLGKMACKIRVVTADGLEIGYARATGRVFAEMLSGLICDIGYIIAAFDSQKRALHDHICNTRVVMK